MTGYTPLFTSVFQGSLCGRYPDLYIWLVMLGLADRHGRVDCHPGYIATVAGVPPELVKQAIETLCQPDAESRSKTEEGRRLLPIPGRGFGWTIVNFQQYREKARLQAKDSARAASGADAERKRRARASSNATAPSPGNSMRPPTSPVDPLSDGDVNVDVITEGERAGARRSRQASKPAKSRKTTIPPDLQLTPAMREYAHGLNIEPLPLFEKFCGHYRAKGGEMVNWEAAWQNWVRREVEYLSKYQGGGRAQAQQDANVAASNAWLGRHHA